MAPPPQAGQQRQHVEGVLISFDHLNQHQVIPSVMLYHLFLFFSPPTLVQATTVESVSVVTLKGELNVWKQSEHWHHECFPRWLFYLGICSRE